MDDKELTLLTRAMFYNVLCFCTGISRGENPHVCYWKQGGPPGTASQGKMCEQFARGEVGQGV